MRIVLLGPPGAGKGTQAKILAKKLNVPHISTGEILRQNVLNSTDLGNKAKRYMNMGSLVPDTLVTEMLEKRLEFPDTKCGFILDGYPRNQSQAKTLDNILKSRNIDIDMSVYLDASEAVIIQRLSGRLVCKSCGANFHVKNMPPKVSMVCDNCSSSLYQRPDDNATTIKRRLQVYQDEVASLMKYYEGQCKLYRVSSDEEPEIVLEKIIEIAQKVDGSLKV